MKIGLWGNLFFIFCRARVHFFSECICFYQGRIKTVIATFSLIHRNSVILHISGCIILKNFMFIVPRMGSSWRYWKWTIQYMTSFKLSTSFSAKFNWKPQSLHQPKPNDYPVLGCGYVTSTNLVAKWNPYQYRDSPFKISG